MRKRFLSLLLVLACVLTLAAVPVIAAEPDPVQSLGRDAAEPTVPYRPTARLDPTGEPEPSPEPSSRAQPRAQPGTQSGRPRRPARGIRRRWILPAIRVFSSAMPIGNMLPGSNASRAQMAAMLVRVFGCTAGKDITHFTDVSTRQPGITRS